MDYDFLRPLDACGAALALALLLDHAISGVRPRRLVGPLLATATAGGMMVLTGRPLVAWLGVGAVATLWSGGRLLLVRRQFESGPSAVRRGGTLIGLAVALASGWLTVQVTRDAWYADGDTLPGEAPTRLPLRPLGTFALTTDRGRTIPTFAVADDRSDGTDPAALEGKFLQEWKGADRIARVAGPDLGSNCHGWTFAGGRCWVRSEDVDDILRDNGYRVVGTPRRGDLAVYRAPSGQVCHTGVVVGRSRGGEVLVESKWAWAGRFLHPVLAQPYSSRYEYQRSRRPGGSLIAVGPALPLAD